MGEFYDDDKFGVSQQHMFTGNDAATLLLTPQAGTAAATKAHTTTGEPWFPQRKINLKKLSYAVKTAATGAGCSLAVDVYKGTTSIGTLAVDQEAALAKVEQSADMDIEVATTEYLRLIHISTTTASDANSAIGQIGMTYQEKYAS